MSDISQAFTDLSLSCDIQHDILAFGALPTCSVNKSSFVKKVPIVLVLEKQLKIGHEATVQFQEKKPSLLCI